jgi:hypothetical protein
MQIHNVFRNDNVLKNLRWTNFFKAPFLYTSNEHYLISKLEGIIILIITRGKGVEIGKVHFDNTFHDYYWFKHAFRPKDLKFCICDFNKSYSILCDKNDACIIYMMYDQLIFKKDLNPKNNNKLGVKNAKFKLIDQDANVQEGH